MTTRPTPNDCKVYDQNDAEMIRFFVHETAFVEVSVLEVAPGEWCTGYEIRVHEGGCGGPIMKCGVVSASRQKAVDVELARAVEYLKSSIKWASSRRRAAEVNELLRQINQYQNQGRLF